VNRRAAAAVLALLAVLVAACSGGEGRARQAEPSPPPTTAPPPIAVLEETRSRVVLGIGGVRVEVGLDPFEWSVEAEGGRVVPAAELHVVRRREVGVASARLIRVQADRAGFAVTFADRTRGVLTIRATAGATLQVELQPDDARGVTAWGVRLGLQRGEMIYGLTERIVDDYGDSELTPAAVGSLDRRGETVRMYVTPTISAYAPFYQSSAGYGLLVDGTMPGVYDVGDRRPDVLGFEFEWDPDDPSASFHLFPGPTHGEILERYTALTGRPAPLPAYAFRHWRGRDELAPGPPVRVDGVAMNPVVAEDLLQYERLGIPPPGVYHFDRPWATGPEGYGELRFDHRRFPNAEAMLRVLADRGSHLDVWVSNWAIGARGQEARRLGYLAPGSDRAIDFTDDDAAQWFRDGLTAFLRSPEGSHVDGFFVDRSEEGDVPSTAEDIWADGRNGRQLHNAYPLLLQGNVRDVLEAERPEDGFAIARASYTGTQALVATWGGDTHSRTGIQIPEAPPSGASTDLGLRSVLISIQRAAFLGLPFWGSDIGGYSDFADREVFARWIEVGAASPLMRFHGKGNDAPWDMPTRPRYDRQMIDLYRRYVVLHDSLQPYLVDLGEEAVRTGLTPVRPLVFSWPDEAGARDRWDEWMLGPDLLVAPVWQSGARQREVWFPPGRWIDVWDRDLVIEGPTTRTVDAPLDTMPLYAADGSPVLDLIDQGVPA